MEKKQAEYEHLERDTKLMSATINMHLKDIVNNSNVVYYIIQCKYAGQISWELKRRYKQFDQLAKDLKKCYNGVPALPAKTIMPMNDDKLIDKRKEKLGEFVNGIIHREEFYSHPTFIAFFYLGKHVPFLIPNNPLLVGSIRNGRGYGYRECVLDLTHEFAIVASHDIFVANRLDSYFSNLFIKKADPKQKAEVTTSKEKVVGLVEFLKRVDKGSIITSTDGKTTAEGIDEIVPINHGSSISTKDDDGDKDDAGSYFNYQKMFDKAFKYQVIALGWSSELQMIAVGLDSGDVFVYRYELGDLTSFKNEIAFPKVHDGRVMRFAFDERRFLLYSIGEDKKLACIDMKEKLVVTRLPFPGSKLTHFLYDRTSQLGLISDKDAAVYLVNMGKKYPEVYQKVNTKMRGPIRGLFGVLDLGIFIASSHTDGQIKVFRNPNLSAKDGQFTCILQIQTTSGIRCLYYWRERHEIWAGFSGGVVKVFNNVDLAALSAKPETECRTTAICNIWFTLVTSPMHEDDITEMRAYAGGSLLLTVGKDMAIKVGFLSNLDLDGERVLEASYERSCF